jgi:ribulose 1,5-bisphosphate synthetase/thiazole synthase
MSAMVVRKPAHLFLEEVGVPFEDEGDVRSSPILSHLIARVSSGINRTVVLPSRVAVAVRRRQARRPLHFDDPLQGASGM